MATAGSRGDYQLQLPQTPVKDIAWLQVGQTSPILPSFMLERASSRDSAQARGDGQRGDARVAGQLPGRIHKQSAFPRWC
jgi:hypothetical protein